MDFMKYVLEHKISEEAVKRGAEKGVFFIIIVRVKEAY